MKNWIKAIAMGILVLGLAACNETADVKPGTDTSKNSEMTAQQVFQRAQEMSEKQKSMSAVMDIELGMQSLVEVFNRDIHIKMDMELVLDPLAMHQVMKMDMGEDGMMETEIYLTEDGYLMKVPETEEWMKFPGASYLERTGSTANSVDPSLNLNLLEQYVDDFAFEQDDNRYILKLAASGDKFKNLIEDQLDSSGVLGVMGEEMEQVMADMVIHAVEYEIFIDKETFNTTAFNMVMDMEMGEAEERIRIAQNIKADISKINEIKEIKVPQEVLDNAVEQ